MKVGVLATVKVRDGQGPAFEANFLKARSLVRATEPGALVYELSRSRTDPAVYRVLEIYRDEDAFKAHGQAEGFRPVMAALPTLIDGQPELETVDVLD